MRCIHILIQGIVQGVGFRPFLHRLAETHQIYGWVRNTSVGLEGILEGENDALKQFLLELETSPPPLSFIEKIDIFPIKNFVRYTEFTIRESHVSAGSTLISPDIAICPECAAELFTPSNRRYRYPFINCTNCGPRYTIIKALPYDRKRTVMKEFPMCDDCKREYDDIHDRRYHAQPDCCSTCGPQVFYFDTKSNEKTKEDAFSASQTLLNMGGILAVKGIGGFHLACDANNVDAVTRLRQRKHRSSKPLAIMCRSLEVVRRICNITQTEEQLLLSPAHPIVLLSKRKKTKLSHLSFSSRLGVMLPYTPLHMLLMDQTYGGPDTIVLTSANSSECPVILDNMEAITKLKEIADGFLLHNRVIQNRCDDSLLMEWEGRAYYFRKSRGYAPYPLLFHQNVDGIFAMGAEQKASFALGRDFHIFLSPHIGDMKNAETFSHYKSTMETYQKLFCLKPSLYVCDLHPDYLSTQEAMHAAKEWNLPLIQVQHHWAHMASCMADNSLHSSCFGIIWDGTGLGTDGSIWGGEFLIGDYQSFSRIGSIRPILLPGADKAIQEIGRIALALIHDAGVTDLTVVPLDSDKCNLLIRLLSPTLSPKASSIGRLFDGVCALILQKSYVDYEGEAAARIESLSPVETPDFLTQPLQKLSYPLHFYMEHEMRIFDTRPMILNIYQDLKQNVSASHIALRFMATLCCMALDQCLFFNQKKLPVVLSGGVFQNRFLLSGITSLLRNSGFTVYTHRQVSTNDEGICFGQLAIAQKKKPQ